MKKIVTIILLSLLVLATVDAQNNKRHTKTKKIQKTVQKAQPKKTSSPSQDESGPNSNSGKKSATNFCPNNKHPHAIDLDLPSGTKWACCNVGASIPEEYGGFYAFGETKEKKSYFKQNYKYHDGSGSDCFCYTKNFWNVCGTDLDAAHVNWGDNWQMPTNSQIKELIENCIFEFVTINGIRGAKFIGPNGNIIFLPAAGIGGYNTILMRNEKGFYGPGRLGDCNVACGYYDVFFFGEGVCEYKYGFNYRFQGFSIRPVKE
jgi:hypothetical protein